MKKQDVINILVEYLAEPSNLEALAERIAVFISESINESADVIIDFSSQKDQRPQHH